MDAWDEIRTAFQVARLGTISAAADVLEVHHATVIRHVDKLEQRLGVKLFHRHTRGYTPTEAGYDLLQVARATDDQFNQMAARVRGHDATVDGELIVTSLSELSEILTPVLTSFQHDYPDLVIRYLTDTRLLRLHYGEAHVAIRAGTAPDQPDNVVQHFLKQDNALYASPGYAERYGLPESEEELTGHRFIVPDNPAGTRAPVYRWLSTVISPESIGYRASDTRSVYDAVFAGAGLGFLPVLFGETHPELITVLPARDEWASDLWLVTHVDLHRSLKVQTFLKFIKTEARAWPGMRSQRA